MARSKRPLLPQPKSATIPNPPKPVLRDFSIDVSAQVEPENLNSLFNVFFDGFTASDALGVASGAIDIAKTLHWDLGEQVFRLQDWQAGWKIDQQLQGWTFTGIVCDTEKPFTLNAVLDADVSGATPSLRALTVTTTWSFTGNRRWGVPAQRSRHSEDPQPGELRRGLRMTSLRNSSPTYPAVGPSPLPGVALDEGDLVLVPLETDECSQG